MPTLSGKCTIGLHFCTSNSALRHHQKPAHYLCFKISFFCKTKMNYKFIIQCLTSNKWQTRRYQIYEKHFSTDPYNFLFVYVFKFLSVLAFCRWMSFVFTIKDIIASKETIKSKLPNFQIIFWRSPCSWLLHQDWNNCDEMLLVLFLLLWLSR